MSEGGSGNSPPRPSWRLKKLMGFLMDSSSHTEENVTAAGSVEFAGARRKRTAKQLASEGDRDTSGCATSTAKSTSGFASDTSEDIIDTCCICLLPFTDQKVGTPQSCKHIFCLDCIKKWSKNVNTCPVDRRKFDFIVVRARVGGRELRTEPVKVRVEEPTSSTVRSRPSTERRFSVERSPSLERRGSELWDYDWYPGPGPFTIHNSPSLRALLF